MSSNSDLDLENSKSIFMRMTLRLIMMHHNTKSGNKMFRGLKGIMWTNIKVLTLCCDLDFECSNPLPPQKKNFFHTTL